MDRAVTCSGPFDGPPRHRGGTIREPSGGRHLGDGIDDASDEGGGEPVLGVPEPGRLVPHDRSSRWRRGRAGRRRRSGSTCRRPRGRTAAAPRSSRTISSGCGGSLHASGPSNATPNPARSTRRFHGLCHTSCNCASERPWGGVRNSAGCRDRDHPGQRQPARRSMQHRRGTHRRPDRHNAGVPDATQPRSLLPRRPSLRGHRACCARRTPRAHACPATAPAAVRAMPSASRA
jgi:hypothetical protein